MSDEEQRESLLVQTLRMEKNELVRLNDEALADYGEVTLELERLKKEAEVNEAKMVVLEEDCEAQRAHNGRLEAEMEDYLDTEAVVKIILDAMESTALPQELPLAIEQVWLILDRGYM